MFANFTDLSTINTKHSTITVHCYAASAATIKIRKPQALTLQDETKKERARISASAPFKPNMNMFSNDASSYHDFRCLSVDYNDVVPGCNIERHFAAVEHNCLSCHVVDAYALRVAYHADFARAADYFRR